MIVVECSQGGDDARWLECHLAIPTASEFNRIITATGAPVSSATRSAFLHEKVAERVSGCIQTHFVSAAMERGTKLEQRGREWYAMTYDCDVEQIGFAYMDKRRLCGCSPDGLVGDDGGIEIKCPLRHNMIGELLQVQRGKCPGKYIAQIQGCMWITGRSFWDLVLYTEDHGIPSAALRIDADPAYHEKLAELVPAFTADVERTAAKIEELKR